MSCYKTQQNKKPYEGLCEVELLENTFCFGMRTAETHSDMTSSSNKTFRQMFLCGRISVWLSSMFLNNKNVVFSHL